MCSVTALRLNRSKYYNRKSNIKRQKCRECWVPDGGYLKRINKFHISTKAKDLGIEIRSKPPTNDYYKKIRFCLY